MAPQKASSFDSPDRLPDLKHGIPGVEWHRDTAAESKARPRRAIMPADDTESYALYLWLIFGVALILRLLVVLAGPYNAVEQAYTPTTEHHLRLADNLVEHQTFGLAEQPAGSITAQLDTLRAQRGELPTVAGTDLHPEFYTTPGYPALLAITRMVTPDLRWWLVAQCFLGALCVPVVYRLGRGMIDRKMPAALAAVVVALHPAFIIAPAALAADTVVTLLVLAGLWMVSSTEQRGFRGVTAGGLSFGGAALFAPVLAWLAPVAAVWIVLTERRLRSVALAVALLLGAAIPVGAWTYRNTQQGLEAWPSAQLSVGRLFGSVASARNPLAGPYDANTTRQLMAELETALGQAANKQHSVLTVVDTMGREMLTTDRAAHLDGLRHGATQLGLDHGVGQAFARLDIDYAPTGYAAHMLGQLALLPGQQNDPTTGYVINAWVGLNAFLIVAALLGSALMLWRCRVTGLLLGLCCLGFLVYFSNAATGVNLQPITLALLGLLAAAAFAPGPLRVKRAGDNKVRNIQEPDHTAPMATAESLRVGRGPIPAMATGRPTPAMSASTAAAMRSREDASVKDDVHPMLRSAPGIEEEPTMRPLMFSSVSSGGGRPI